MRAVAESLKRLYEQGRISREQLAERVEKKTISLDEYNLITNAEEQSIEPTEGSE